jgi:hypothetical protein
MVKSALMLVSILGCGTAPVESFDDGSYTRMVYAGEFALTANEQLAGGWDRLAAITTLIYAHRDIIGGDQSAIAFNAGAYLELHPVRDETVEQCGHDRGESGCMLEPDLIFTTWLAGAEFGDVELLAHEVAHLELYQATGDADDGHARHDIFCRPTGEYCGTGAPRAGTTWAIAEEWRQSGQ